MLNLDTPAGIYGSNHGRQRSLVDSAMPGRDCDLCGGTYLGRGRCQPPLGRDLTACTRAQGWRRSVVVAALIQGEGVPGLTANSRLRREAHAILVSRVSSQPHAATEARGDEPEAEPPNQGQDAYSKDPSSSRAAESAPRVASGTEMEQEKYCGGLRIGFRQHGSEEKAPHART